MVAQPPARCASLIRARRDLAARLSSRIRQQKKLRLIEVFAGLERASSDTLGPLLKENSYFKTNAL